MPLSCKSASALDSLPRQSSVKRSSSALNRLHQRKLAFQVPNRPGEFGRPIRKSLSKRSDSKSTSKGLASDDLPMASSDLYNDHMLDRGAFSDCEEEDEEEKKIHLLSAMRPRSTSPTKSLRRTRAPQEVDSAPSSPKAVPASPTKRVVPVPAQKRIIRKDRISHPSNFQHTGHIGAASYTAMQPADAEKIRLQLSEVAAALNFMDDEQFSVTSRSASDRVVSKGSESTLASSIQPEGEKKAEVVDEETSSVVPTKGEGPISAKTVGATPKKEVLLNRAASKRKPVPGPRNLVLLYDEFKSPANEASTVKGDASPSQPANAPFSVIMQEEEKSVIKPLPTIRAPNGKRLVPGPAGDYITDTANGRWNSALHEITNALKAEGETDDNTEEEDLQDGLRRADAILSRLGAS